MLIDKPNFQINNFLGSPPSSASQAKHSRSGEIAFSKLPKLSSPSHLVNFTRSDSVILKPLPENAAHPSSKNNRIPPDSAAARGPKVYNKHLPEVFLQNVPALRKISQKSPQEGKQLQRPQSSKHINFEAAFLVPQKKKEGFKDHKFLSPPPHFDKIRDQDDNIRPVSHRKFSRGTSNDNLANISASEDRIHDKSLLNANNIGIEKMRHGSGASSFRRNHTSGEHNISKQNLETHPNEGSEKISIKDNDFLGEQLQKILGYDKKFLKIPKARLFTDVTEDNHQDHLINKNNTTPYNGPPLQLNELITLKKVRVTQNSGAVKRMLHAPTLKMLDVQEEPISDFGSRGNEQLKDWLNCWKTNFSASKYLAHIYWCFWNSPEGCVSILTEPARNGLLSDVVSNYGGLPETCIQNVANDVLKGINEVHKKLGKPHGNIRPGEIMISQKGTMKLMPGICKSLPGSSHGNLVSPKSTTQEGANKLTFKVLVQKASKEIKQLEIAVPDQPSFANDIFDFGLLLLQCAIGEFSFYDSNNGLNWENIKMAVANPTFQRSDSYACCLIHSEVMVRKIIKSMSETHVKRPSQSKSSTRESSKGPENSGFTVNSQSSFIPLLEVLKSRGRFSGVFESFLCGCLKLNASKRADVKSLLAHKFLSEDHVPSGPLLTFDELVDIENIESMDYKKELEEEHFSQKHLEKLQEALKVVFLNKEVKEKFGYVFRKAQKTLNQKRLIELAKELGVTMVRLENTIKECIEA